MRSVARPGQRLTREAAEGQHEFDEITIEKRHAQLGRRVHGRGVGKGKNVL
jgi:hypothetical protein